MDFELIMPLIMVFVVLPLTYVGVVYYSKMRSEAYQQLAQDLQFEWSQGDEPFAEAKSKLLLFHRGIRQTIFDAARGQNSTDRLAIMDYTFSSGAGSNGRSANQALVLIEGTAPTLPSFQVYARKRYIEPNAERIGMSQVECFHDPGFDSQYVVNAADERLVVELLDAATRKRIASGPLVYIECHDGAFVYHHYRLTKAADMRALLNEAIQMRSRLIEASDRVALLS